MALSSFLLNFVSQLTRCNRFSDIYKCSLDFEEVPISWIVLINSDLNWLYRASQCRGGFLRQRRQLLQGRTTGAKMWNYKRRLYLGLTVTYKTVILMNEIRTNSYPDSCCLSPLLSIISLVWAGELTELKKKKTGAREPFFNRGVKVKNQILSSANWYANWHYKKYKLQ